MMLLGMSLTVFTEIHVAISLIGIVTGLVVLFGMLGGRWLRKWNGAFLLTTILTSVTGFMFPFVAVGPPHIVGGLSLIVLAIALLALYRFRLAGKWRWIYVISSSLALYFNVFVAVVQAFLKLPFFHALAPYQTEPPFKVAQLLVLLAFIVLVILAVRRFHPRMN
jgi:hypothetical protein